MRLDRLRAERQPGTGCLVRPALGHQSEHVTLSVREGVELAGFPLAVGEARYDLGVEDAAAGDDPPQRVGEFVGVGDAILEEVADAAGPVRRQREDVVGLDVLGEHEDADFGMLGSDGVGGTEPFVGVRRGHADVEHGHVGVQRVDETDSFLPVAGHADNIEAGVVQEGGEAAAEKDGVFG